MPTLFQATLGLPSMMKFFTAPFRPRDFFHRRLPENSGDRGSGPRSLKSLWLVAGMLHHVNTPKRRGSLKRTIFPESITISTWSCLRGASPTSQILSEPDIPRWISKPPSTGLPGFWPWPSSINRYLARRQHRSTGRPTAFCTSGGTGHRRFGLRTRISPIECPLRNGSIPRRVVSTSGNSGNQGASVRAKKNPPGRRVLSILIQTMINYLILPSLYITCLRTTGSYFLTSILAGVFFLFLSVV